MLNIQKLDVNNMDETYSKGIIIGSSPDLHVDPRCETGEIRTNITIKQHKGLKLWGQISGQQGIVIPHVQVKLVQIIGDPNKGKY